jgi:hypothetical protein
MWLLRVPSQGHIAELAADGLDVFWGDRFELGFAQLGHSLMGLVAQAKLVADSEAPSTVLTLADRGCFLPSDADTLAAVLLAGL